MPDYMYGHDAESDRRLRQKWHDVREHRCANDCVHGQPDLRTQLTQALALAFTSEYGPRNPDWDIDGPDDDTNPYHLTVPIEERAQRSPYVHWVADDGLPSFRAATIPELIDTIMPLVVAAQTEARAEVGRTIIERWEYLCEVMEEQRERVRANGGRDWPGSYLADRQGQLGWLLDLFAADFGGDHPNPFRAEEPHQ